jgi:hypothetical protein
MLNKNRVHTIVYTLDELVRPFRALNPAGEESTLHPYGA